MVLKRCAFKQKSEFVKLKAELKAKFELCLKNKNCVCNIRPMFVDSD
jgi:hypothetical protein